MSAALLAFDTSTEALAIAVAGPAGRLAWNGPGGAQASTALLPRIHDLLGRSGQRLEDLDAIVFGCGPGAFTGLRTACSVAQGLALGAGLPVIAVDSLMIVAEAARLQCVAVDPPADFGVVMDARMGELYAARYRWLGGDWQVMLAPCLVQPAVLVQQWQADPPAALSGSGLALLGGALGGSLGGWLGGASACQAIEFETNDRATALLQLAERLHRRGAGVDAAQALPIYLRDRVAQTTAERLARAMDVAS